MALNAMDQDTVSRGLTLIKMFHDQSGELNDLNVLFDADGGLKSRYTQQDLDTVASFYGMTTTQFDDAMYVLTGLILPILNNSRTQLVVPAPVAR